MGYTFTVGRHYRLKKDGVYPWPWKGDPDRTMELYTSDIFCVDEKGVIYKQTGLGTFGHLIPFDDLVEHEGPVRLEML